MRMQSAFLGLVCVSWGFAQACGGDDSGLQDGSSDGTVPDVVQQQDVNNQNDVVQQQDTGTPDTGPGDDGSTTDASDGGTKADTGIAMWTCGSVNVTDCSLCTGFTQPCAYCLAFPGDAAALVGACVQTGMNCLNSIPQGYQDCPCNMDASACPEDFQVCTNNGRCHTCTDNGMNNGLKCEDGKTCAADAGCK